MTFRAWRFRLRVPVGHLVHNTAFPRSEAGLRTSKPLAGCHMPFRANSITPAIIETLYGEALALAEDARAAFQRSGVSSGWGAQPATDEASGERIALSCEALRTTTRMMHALAWLLNHRAYFAGELSEFQLRRHGRLPVAQLQSDAAQLGWLNPHTVLVVQRSQAFYARIERLELNWRGQGPQQPRPVQRLRARIGQSFAGS